MNKKLAVLGAALVILAAACGSDHAAVAESSAAVSISLDRITPEELSEKLAAGPATVVNFWASWCGPCRAEAPVLRKTHEEYGDRVRFIGVAVDDTAAAAADFMESYGIAFDNYLAESSPMMAHFATRGIPFTIFTDSEGAVLNVHQGIIDEQTLGLWTDELSRSG